MPTICLVEVGRVELFRALGFSYKLLEHEHQCILPVVDARCRYRSSAATTSKFSSKPAFGGARLAREVCLPRLAQGIGWSRACASGEGETTHVVCDAKMSKKPLPEKYAAAPANHDGTKAVKIWVSTFARFLR